MHSRAERLALGLILALLIFTRMGSLSHLLPDFCVEDERWIQEGSLHMLRGLTFDPGTHKYPGLMFEVVALAQAAYFAASEYKAILHIQGWDSFRFFLSQYPFDFSATILVGRMVVLIFTLACILLFYSMLRKRVEPLVALVVILLMASAPAFQFCSLFLKTDLLLLLGIFISLEAALRIEERGLKWDYALGALGLGICLASKYHPLPLIPLFIAHRYRFRELSLIRTVSHRSFLIMLALSLVVFFIGSPMSFLDVYGMIQAWTVEFAIQNKLSPLLKASPVHWWHKPVLFQLVAVLPVVLGLPLYIISLLGLKTLNRFRRHFGIILFSYPASYLVFMIIFSRLGYPHLYLPLVPFLCIIAARLLVDYFREGSRKGAVVMVLALILIPLYNLLLFKGFTSREQGVLNIGKAGFDISVAQLGNGLAFVPYYANPGVVFAGSYYLPQFMLSRKLIQEQRPEVILLHHALYQGYANNPELKNNPAYLGYVWLLSGKAGYKEYVIQEQSRGEWPYTTLLPDLKGIRTSVFLRQNLDSPLEKIGED